MVFKTKTIEKFSNKLYICIIRKNKNMIHTIKVDDSIPSGKKIIKDLRRFRKAVKFVNPASTGVPPEGYMTGDEFEKSLIEEINQYYKENGLLQ